MQQVIGVKFHSNKKSYFFNPKDIAFEVGDGVIVETARGIEFGTVTTSNHFVDDGEIVKPLKDVIRKAPHPRSREVINAMAVLRGSQSGLLMAESFQMVFGLGV